MDEIKKPDDWLYNLLLIKPSNNNQVKLKIGESQTILLPFKQQQEYYLIHFFKKA